MFINSSTSLLDMVLIYFNVLEDIVQHTIASVGTIERNSSPSQRNLIVGGMATQLHSLAYPQLLRPTLDLDLTNCEDYKDYKDFSDRMGDPLLKEIRKRGYQAQSKAGRLGYEVKVMKGQGDQAQELFFIHLDALPQPYRENEKMDTSERIKNSIKMEVKGVPVHVTRIEEIIPRKLKRLRDKIQEMTDGDELLESLHAYVEQGRWSDLSIIPLDEWVTRITESQNEFTAHKITRPPARYVASKDLFDVCLLSRVIEANPAKFNRSYYLDVKKRICT